MEGFGQPLAARGGGIGPGPIAPLIGELLIARCGVTAESIDRALAKQREEGGLIGEVLVRLKLIDEDQLALALSLQAEMQYLRDLPRAEDIPPELIDKLPINFARQRLILPLGRDASNRVMVAVADPTAVDVIDAVSVLLGEPVESYVASSARIVDHINKTYSRLRGGAELEESGKKEETEDDEYQSEELVDMLDANDEAPIIRWVNSLMFQAAKEGASDIHIRPGEKEISVRYRIDGVLRRSQARAEEVPRLDRRPREDHGRPQHRREAPAAGRPHPPQDGRQGRRHARRDRADRRR
jgi:general secretion pathway protein E